MKSAVKLIEALRGVDVPWPTVGTKFKNSGHVWAIKAVRNGRAICRQYDSPGDGRNFTIDLQRLYSWLKTGRAELADSESHAKARRVPESAGPAGLVDRLLQKESIQPGDVVDIEVGDLVDSHYGQLWVVGTGVVGGLWTSEDRDDVKTGSGRGLRHSFVSAVKKQGAGPWIKVEWNRDSQVHRVAGEVNHGEELDHDRGVAMDAGGSEGEW